MTTPRPSGKSATDRDLRERQNAWQNLVLALGDVDDVTTEVIRVRAATHHACRT
jgi:hypothetical protein